MSSRMPKNSKINDDGQFEALRPKIEQIIEEKLAPIQLAVTELKSKITKMEKTVHEVDKFSLFINSVYEENKKEIDNIKSKLKDLRKEKDTLQQSLQDFSNNLKQSSETLNDYEQYSRRDCVEIRGIPKCPPNQQKKY